MRRLRLALTCLRFGLELGLWHSSAALHGADVERRAFSGERFAERGLHNAERFEESVLPAAGSAASRPGFWGRRRAGVRSIVQRSERSRERAAPRGPFVRAAFADFSALCLPTGLGARFSGKACLVFAGRRFCRMFGRFLFGAVLRVFGAACRAFGPQSTAPPFKP